VIRVAVLLALAACSEAAPTYSTPTHSGPHGSIYRPAYAAWPLGVPTGTIGRSQSPQPALAEAVVGSQVAWREAGALSPLRMPTPWTVPGDGPARAVIYGLDFGRHAVELIDVDAGVVLWRDTRGCGAPVVGVTAEAIVCADATGVRAIAVADGKQRWKSDAAFVAMTDDRVITAGAGESVILDANVGDDIAHVKLPAGVLGESIIASCGDAGRELFANGQDGRLVHIVEAAGGPKVAWSVPDTTPYAIDACDGDSVLVTRPSDSGTALVSISRATGAVTGNIEGVHGYWPARDGSAQVEVSTDAGVALHSRTLSGPSEAVGLPALRELLAKRGELRLVRATTSTTVLLDRKGVRAYLPLRQAGAVLGDTSIIAGTWSGLPGETVRRVRIPEARYGKRLRLPLIGLGVGVTAELRDLPPVTQVDASGAVAKIDAGKVAVESVALDPTEPALYATALEKDDDSTSAGVARFDLKAKAWSWYRADGCGAGEPVGLAVSKMLVACAARIEWSTWLDNPLAKDGVGNVHATSRDGQPLWTWSGDNVDGVDAVGELVLVRDAASVHLLDAKNGHLLGDFDSDDGGAIPAAILDVDGMQMLVVAQHGRVLGLLPRADMVPAWTLAVNGVVKTIEPAGDGVLVALEDGDAYRVDARTGKADGVAGIGLEWHSAGDLLAGTAPGGPIPPAEMPTAAAAAADEPDGAATDDAAKAGRKKGAKTAGKKGAKAAKKTEAKPAEDFDESLGPPPRLARDVWPDPGPLPASLQVTLYDVSGVYRARNDYYSPLSGSALTPVHARSAKAPLVLRATPFSEVLVVEPEHGDPVQRVQLPDDTAPGTAFSTVVDGKPVVGVLLANPLRVVMF
jgi:hypothetical protein